MRRAASFAMALAIPLWIALAASPPGVASAAPDRPERILAKPRPCTGCWIPPQVSAWQWQLSGPVDMSIDVPMYDIDMFDNSSSVVAKLHAAGRHVVCYIDAGTWENWRPDANKFPKSVLGKKNGWPGERWLDIRRLDVLGPIMEARLDRCARKGFDSVEFDNVDGYSNDTGFPLTAQDQLTYNSWLADQAHARRLSAALKNDVEQVPALLPYFDWALDEQCFQYHECRRLEPFIEAGKAVMEVEYKLPLSQFCPQANQMNFNSMKKRLSLKVWRKPCR